MDSLARLRERGGERALLMWPAGIGREFTPAGEFLFLFRQEKKPKEGDPGRPTLRATLVWSGAWVLCAHSAALQGDGVYLRVQEQYKTDTRRHACLWRRM